MYNILTQSDIEEITNYINQYRNLHQSNDLIFDQDISTISQLLSIKLLKFKKLDINDINNPNYTYITNLSLKSKNSTLKNIKLAIDYWYKENKYYNDKKSNNFSGLVWKSSTKFGIGYSYVNGKSSVCLLIYEKGNKLNEYEDNVLPKI
jgi:hypothetical protein